MLNKIIISVCYGLGIMVLVLLTSNWFFLRAMSYETLISIALHEIQREDLRTTLISKYFPVSKFLVLQKLSFLITILSGVALILCIWYKAHIMRVLTKISTKFHGHFKFWIEELTSSSKKSSIILLCLLCIIFVRSVLISDIFALQYDEVWNYNYFLSKNVLYSFVAYNNYPLHNIITSVLLKFLPINAFTIRLSVILFGQFTCVLVFIIVKKMFREDWLALCGVVIFSCLPVSVYYMLYARGVMVNMFFLVCIYYSVTRLVEKRLTFFQVLGISSLNALATYSILSHIYFIVFSSIAMVLYLVLHKKYALLLQVFCYSFLSILLSGILISPFLLGTGIGFGLDASIANTSYLALHDLPFHCYSEFYGGWWYTFYILFLLNIILLFVASAKKYQFLIIINLVFMASIFLIKWLTHIFPPERALTYLVLVPFSTIILLCNILRTKKIITISLAVCFSVASFYQAYTGSFMNWSKVLDKRVKQLSDVLMKNNIESVYNYSPTFYYFVPGLVYYYSLNHKRFNYYTSIKESTRYKPISEVDKVDCIVVSGTTLPYPAIFKEGEDIVYSLSK
ncbi:hypothetical protein ACFOW1_11950 [Parasediminibacterium paludis]|uniref:Dolichyl-phosphate-mannose-protein mannosyltransferase n=1 Tax=Parasediminibacterium paludis TaxID=908966 RepID=A0ABV8PYU4_9BACT